MDKKDLVRTVIRAVEHVRRMHKGESPEQWEELVADRLDEARQLLGAFGEGKGLSLVVGLCAQFLQWKDLREVGVEPSSEPAWKVLQIDLVDPGLWGGHERRTRMLKMLGKLSHKLDHLPTAEKVPDHCATVIDFCEEHGLRADTLRQRIRRHNERVTEDDGAIRPEGMTLNHRMVYDRADLVRLLTDNERARCG